MDPRTTVLSETEKKRVITSHRTLSIKYMLKRTRAISVCDFVGFIRNITSPRRFTGRETLTTYREDFETRTNKRHTVFNRFFFSHTLIHSPSHNICMRKIKIIRNDFRVLALHRIPLECCVVLIKTLFNARIQFFQVRRYVSFVGVLYV